MTAENKANEQARAETLDYRTLKERQRQIRDRFPESLKLRTLSRLQRAEQ